MKFVCCLAGALALAAIAGCSAGEPSPEPSEPPVTFGGTSPDASASESAEPSEEEVWSLQRNATDAFGPLPLEAYEPSVAEDYLLTTTADALADECMAEFGFESRSSSRPLEELEIEHREGRNRLFGVIDVEQARETGYLPAYIVAANTRHASDTSAPDPAHEFVYTGLPEGITSPEDQTESPGEVDGKAIPPNGCLGQAREQVYGSSTTMMHFVFADDLDTGAWFDAQVDQRVVAAEQAWVACMRERGFSVNSMWNDDSLFLDVPDEERPTEEERQMAVADAECNLDVGYAEVYYEVLVEYENQAIEDNQLALTEEREELDRTLAHANELAKDN